MTAIIPKQMNIPISSRYIICSLSHTRAIIVIQKVFVLKQIMKTEMGATDPPQFISKKLICPVKLLMNSDHFFSHGNILSGLIPRIAHHTVEKGNAQKQRHKTNSAGLNPSLATTLNAAMNATPNIIARLIAIIARHLLSFGSGLTSGLSVEFNSSSSSTFLSSLTLSLGSS